MSGLPIRTLTSVVAAAVLASLVLPARADDASPAHLQLPVLTLADTSGAGAKNLQTTETSAPPTTNFATIYFENDGSAAHPGGTDKHYTSGVGFSLAYQPLWARSLGKYVWSLDDQFNPEHQNASFAVGLVAYQDMYTPSDLSRSDPIYNDRPYAALSNGGLFWQRAVAPEHEGGWIHATLEHFELDLGIVGPSAQGEETQKFVHSNIATSSTRPEGWNNQINDEFGFNFTYLRKWRFTLADQADQGIAVQLIPVAGFTAGTLSRYATAELVARAGWNLPDDFGPGRMHEVAAFTNQRGVKSPLGFYVFGRMGGQLIEHNTFLEGGNFRDSPVTVTQNPTMGELQGGLALQLYHHVELIYSQTLRTREFEGQDGPDVYGAITLTFSWNF